MRNSKQSIQNLLFLFFGNEGAFMIAITAPTIILNAFLCPTAVDFSFTYTHARTRFYKT